MLQIERTTSPGPASGNDSPVHVPASSGLGSSTAVSVVLAIVDLFAVVVAFLLAGLLASSVRVWVSADASVALQVEPLVERWVQVAVLGVGLCGWFAATGHYTQRQSLNHQARRVLVAVLISALIDGYLQFAMKAELSRLWLTATWALAGPLILASRIALKHALFALGPWRCPTAVIGTADRVAEIEALFHANPYIGYVPTELVVVGSRFDPESQRRALNAASRSGYVILALDEQNSSDLVELTCILEERMRVPFAIVPAIRGIGTSRLELRSFFGQDLLVIDARPSTRPGAKLGLKRMIDATAAGAALLVLSPLLLLVAAIVKLDGGPALYGSPRIGRGGKVFHALKFRSMVPNADAVLRKILAEDPELRREWEQNFKLARDPRITRFGRFIRETSVDELPQLINVLRGQMSLVGPRPLLPSERDVYNDRGFELYSQVTPGITGVWQVSGRNSLHYSRRIELNTWYVKNWSPWLDVMILLKTISVVARRTGAS